MSCPGADELTALSQDALAPEQQSRLRAHVSSCATCSSALASLQAADRARRLEQATVDLHRIPTGAAAASPGLAVGTRVGRFVISAEVGEGGMGRVYAAHDPELDRQVAIKLLNPPGSASLAADGRARLLREAQAMARLSHPNVVSLYDVGTFEQQVFLAMELVQGVTLDDWLHSPRTADQVLTVFRAAGEGLAAAHHAGLVHRDFKPLNVLIGDDLRVRVLDFGLARTERSISGDRWPKVDPVALSPLDSALTQDGQLSGTPGYVAPEVAFGGLTDARSDQFAFCVALYEALFGQKPWPAQSMTDYLRALKAQPVASLPGDSKVPAWVTRVVLKGLSADPAGRYPSMRALLTALARNPAVARRRWALAAGLLVVATASTVSLVRGRAPVCDAEGQRLAGVWDGPVRQTVQLAFAATGRPGASDTFDRVARLLDAWSLEWVKQATTTCREVQGERSGSELGLLRQLCLERRRGELKALTELLSKSDPEVFDQAVNASRLLVDAQRCIDPRVVSGASTPLGGDAATRARIAELRARLDAVKALFDAGRFSQAIDAARQVAADAHAAQLTAVEAEALNLQGRVQGRAYQLDDALKTLNDALAAAQASQVDIEIFNASVWLAHVYYHASRVEEAERVLSIAEATQKRLGDDELLLADLDESRAGVLGGAHQYEQALALRTTALELKRRRLGKEHPESIAALINVSKSLIDLGRLEESNQHTLEALELTQSGLGPEHPALVMIRCNLSSSLSLSGEYEEARRQGEEGSKLVQKLQGPDAALLGWCLGNLAVAQAGLGEGDAALANATRSLAIIRKTRGEQDVETNESLMALAKAQLVLRQYDAAIGSSQQGLKLVEANLGPEDYLASEHLTCIGWAQLRLGKAALALGALERAQKIREKAGSPTEHADTHWALAQARWASGLKPGAIEAATAAVRELTPFKALAGRRAEIEAWLAAHR